MHSLKNPKRDHREGFFARSPEDHFTVWEPSRVKGILKAYGFRVERIRITGHHPERLPGLRFLATRPRFNPFDRLLAAAGNLVSRAFGLGDTFEIYAVREEAREEPRQGVEAQGLPYSPGSELRAPRGALRGPNRN